MNQKKRELGTKIHLPIVIFMLTMNMTKRNMMMETMIVDPESSASKIGSIPLMLDEAVAEGQVGGAGYRLSHLIE